MVDNFSKQKYMCNNRVFVSVARAPRPLLAKRIVLEYVDIPCKMLAIKTYTTNTHS